MNIEALEDDIKITKVSSLWVDGKQLGVRFEIKGTLTGVPYENLIDLDMENVSKLSSPITENLYDEKLELKLVGNEFLTDQELETRVYAEEFTAREFMFTFGNLLKDLIKGR